MSKLRRRKGAVAAVAIAAAFFTVSVAVPAMGGPTALSAATLASKVKRALKISKKANKRSKVAKATADQALAKAATPGPIGPKGDKGDKGDAGATGPRGPSDGFAFASTGFVDFAADTEQTLATVNLPAGSFVITAKVIPNNNDATTRQYVCRLLLGGTQIDLLGDGLELDIEGTGENDRDVAALTSAGSIAAPGTADLVCQTNSPSGSWGRPSLTAIQVATLTGP